MSAATPPSSSPTRHCQIAECSESIGRSQASGLAYGSRASVARPRRARSPASGMTRWPPATSVSLLAVATTLPARSAARTGRRLTTPPVRDDDEVDVVARRQRLERVGAADEPRAARQVQAGRGGLVAQRHDGGSESRGLLGEQRGVGARRQGDDPERVRLGRQHVDRLAPDRAGRAEQRDPARRSLACPLVAQRRRARTYSVTTGAANRNESTRSSIPPWPGMSVPESLAPAARLRPTRRGRRPGPPRRSAARGPARGAGSGRGPRAGPRPRRWWRSTPPTRPSIVFDGEMWVRNLRPAEVLADEIGARVVGPDREHQQQDPAALAAERVERRVGRHDRRRLAEADDERQQRDVERAEDGRHPGLQAVLRVDPRERRRRPPGRSRPRRAAGRCPPGRSGMRHRARRRGRGPSRATRTACSRRRSRSRKTSHRGEDGDRARPRPPGPRPPKNERRRAGPERARPH